MAREILKMINYFVRTPSKLSQKVEYCLCILLKQTMHFFVYISINVFRIKIIHKTISKQNTSSEDPNRKNMKAM